MTAETEEKRWIEVTEEDLVVAVEMAEVEVEVEVELVVVLNVRWASVICPLSWRLTRIASSFSAAP